MYCINCGSQIDDDTKFCPNCGAKQENAPAEQEPLGAQGPQSTMPQDGNPPQTEIPPQTQGQEYSWQNAPASYPQKSPNNNVLKIVIFSAAGALVIALVVWLAFFLKGLQPGVSMQNTPTTITANGGLTTDADPSAEPTAGADATGSMNGAVDFQIVTQQPSETQDAGEDTGSLIYYETPGLSEVPMYSVLTEGVWTSVGLATNSYQVSVTKAFLRWTILKTACITWSFSTT